MFRSGGVRNLFRTMEDEFQRMRLKWENQFPAASSGFAAADLQETDKAFILKLDLPGLKKQDIKVG